MVKIGKIVLRTFVNIYYHACALQNFAKKKKTRKHGT